MNTIKKYGLNLIGNTVEGLLKLFNSNRMENVPSKKSMYETVVESYQNLERLFPQEKLDKRLESYIISFVDNQSLKSMLLVSKSWFLRAYLFHKSRIELDLISEIKGDDLR